MKEGDITNTPPRHYICIYISIFVVYATANVIVWVCILLSCFFLRGSFLQLFGIVTSAIFRLVLDSDFLLLSGCMLKKTEILFLVLLYIRRILEPSQQQTSKNQVYHENYREQTASFPKHSSAQVERYLMPPYR